jgi:hypothetical protein
MKKIILINIALILILVFVFLQIFYPLFFELPKFNYKIWENKPITFFPNTKIRSHTSEFKQLFKTNSSGFNDEEHMSDIDILILGDSMVEAVQVARKNHFSEILKKNYLKKKLKINKIGMSGYGNSHYLANYIEYRKKLNPKIIVIVNTGNDLGNNFCDKNTLNCLHISDVCKIQNETQLKNKIKFLHIEKDNFKFNFSTEKNIGFTLRSSVIKNYLGKIDAYYAVKDIISKVKKIIKKQKIYKTKDDGTNCKIDTNNIYVKNYYKKINELIYNEIVLKDKKKLIFITSNKIKGKISKLVPNKNLEFIKSSIEKAGYPHINLDEPMIEYTNKTMLSPNFKNDGHWNEVGHEVVAFELLNYLNENNYL